MSVLRVLSLGQIVDTAFSFWRREAFGLFGVFIGFQALQYLATKVLSSALLRLFPEAFSLSRLLEHAQNEPSAFLDSALWLAPLALVYSVVIFGLSSVASIAATVYGLPRYLNESQPSARHSLAQTWRCLPRAMAVSTLAAVWGFGVLLAALVPGTLTLMAAFRTLQNPALAYTLFVLGGVALALGVLVTALWFIMRTVVLPQVLAYERRGAWSSFVRSGELTSGRIAKGFLGWVKVRLTVLITVVTAILSLISVAAGLPTSVLAIVYGNALDPMNATPERIPVALAVFGELFQQVASALFVGLYVVFQFVYYVDMRCRREGFDLERRIASWAQH